MNNTLTITLPNSVRRSVGRLAKLRQVSATQYVQYAVEEKLWRDALEAARRELVPKARAKGVFTDEDVFRLVS